MKEINIQFENGKKGIYKKGSTLTQILKETFPNNNKKFIAADVNGQIIDLSSTIQEDQNIHLLTCNDKSGLQIFWHSASHLLAYAVKSLYPEVKLGIGPSIANGFYYDFVFPESLSVESFSEIENLMQELVNKDIPFVKKKISKQDAISLFRERNESFKVEMINNIENDQVSIYSNDNFIDLCRGPHVSSLSYIKYFKLLSLAGAYWHGDERNPMMQRIYGIAYSEKKTLKKHLNSIVEAKKRDHRLIAKKLDLFSFHSEGPGFPFWHHNGMIIFNEVTVYMHETLIRHGYEEVKTPLILNEELWHKSGHWDNYKNNMYFTTIDDKNYAVKPMNCPGGLLIYKEKLHSYRDLPLKLSEMGVVHRNEKSGVLHGLFRVRQFTQDDAHVFCTPEQLEDEIIKLINLVDEVYKTFDFTDFLIELSTRPLKSIGDDKMWTKAENALTKSLNKLNVSYQLNKGEGAFYGPKIDFHIKDSLGRIWQCGTIQVDFSMPERFELEYIGSDGNKHRPVMLHRAILGSIERFIGIIIEHFGGSFPLWLSPVQCLIVPISEKHHDYAVKINTKFVKHNIRSRVDVRNEKVGYKIREAENQKIPFMCIVGDKEFENNTISVRQRKKGNIGNKNLSEFINEIVDLIKRRINHF